MINGKKILVTGGAGSIGSELVRQLAPTNTVKILDINETGTFDLYEELKQNGYDIQYRVGSILNYEMLKSLFDGFNPDIVFHCAAYKHVTPMDDYPREAVNTNIIGTLNILSLCDKDNQLINISTDKVVNAHCIMGASKKVAEIAVKNAKYVSVRFGNVLGSRGSVIPIWQSQVDRGEPLTITDERMERYFMTIPQACKLVIDAYEIANPGEILILDMGKQIKIIDLAREIIEKSGKDIELKTIGIRQGETLSEKLMTEDEEARAVKKGNYYVI